MQFFMVTALWLPLTTENVATPLTGF